MALNIHLIHEVVHYCRDTLCMNWCSWLLLFIFYLLYL